LGIAFSFIFQFLLVFHFSLLLFVFIIKFKKKKRRKRKKNVINYEKKMLMTKMRRCNINNINLYIVVTTNCGRFENWFIRHKNKTEKKITFFKYKSTIL